MTAGDETVDATTPAAGDLLIGVPILFVTTADLTPVRVVDANALLETISTSRFLDGLDEGTRQRTIALFEDMNEQNFAALLLKVPFYLSLCHGTSLVPGEPVEYQTELAAPIGNATVMANGRYAVDVVDAETARVRYSLSYDPDSVMDLVRTVLAQVDPGRQPSDEELARVRLQKDDRADCTVSRDTGWVTRMSFESRIEVPGRDRAERYEIEVTASE